ncbi:MraY family glycosyltransferase [Chryseobacterium sp. MFBS3-17]|uniref:MraY family glycosyltransferase n=1 Tax=Chryseobacterium sp. MFBS3-17 TaxID=2886689 RepID=UPI001D0E4CD5|nr:glycosyltransferase family 4 protein [Chryseobacterium sp. MFBS3-17]MCC2591389.1 glycosyltransferase family 4 protein [Chryseobacterium sp. MFBS3-17]
MEYSIVTVLLLIFSFIYFRIAGHYNITDAPNQRSAHSVVTVRGGGVLYPFAYILFILYELWFGTALIQNYLILGTGMMMLCTVSFMDDVKQLSSKIRLVFQFLSVIPLLYFLGVFQVISLWWLPVVLILIIGILNAFNFMDGINGISGLYSLVTLGTLLYINQYVVSFADTDFIVYPALASIVFLFFNFRKKAKCFMGDVGSMGIAFWIVVLIGLLMMKTGELKWILLLTVYGVETVVTIMERIRLRENIMEAHCKHLYQLLVNKFHMPHLSVSTLYAGLQLVISILIIQVQISDYLLIPAVIITAAALYVLLKYNLKKRIANDHLRNSA